MIKLISVGLGRLHKLKYKVSSHILRRYLLKSDARHDLNYCKNYKFESDNNGVG